MSVSEVEEAIKETAHLAFPHWLFSNNGSVSCMASSVGSLLVGVVLLCDTFTNTEGMRASGFRARVMWQALVLCVCNVASSSINQKRVNDESRRCHLRQRSLFVVVVQSSTALDVVGLPVQWLRTQLFSQT